MGVPFLHLIYFLFPMTAYIFCQARTLMLEVNCKFLVITFRKMRILKMMENIFYGGSGLFFCWVLKRRRSCVRLWIDIIEQASFRLIKWVTASGAESKIWILWGDKKQAGKERTPQISLARGRDLIEREWVNWKMLPSFSKQLHIWISLHSAFKFFSTRIKLIHSIEFM